MTTSQAAELAIVVALAIATLLTRRSLSSLIDVLNELIQVVKLVSELMSDLKDTTGEK